METRSHYRAPLGGKIRWVSALTVLLVAGAVVLVSSLATSGNRPDVPLLWGTAVLLVLLLPVTAVFGIRGYRLEPDELVILRPGWKSHIPLMGLTGAEPDPEALQGVVLRVAGNGGFLGVIGWFWSRRLGWFRAWVTDPARIVVLRFHDRTVLVSPDDPAAFLECLRCRMGRH